MGVGTAEMLCLLVKVVSRHLRGGGTGDMAEESCHLCPGTFAQDNAQISVPRAYHCVQAVHFIT